MGNAPSTAGDGPDTSEDVTDRTSALNFDLAFQIVRFCSTRDSASVACTCRALRDMQRDSDQLWWKPVTYQLARESKLYVSEIEHSGLPVSGGTWRREFFRLWTCRDRWREAAEEGVAGRGQVRAPHERERGRARRRSRAEFDGSGGEVEAVHGTSTKSARYTCTCACYLSS